MNKQFASLSLSFIALAGLSASSAYAALSANSHKYFSIASVKTTVHELTSDEIARTPEGALSGMNASTLNSFNTNENLNVSESLVIIDQIMNLGARVWKVVDSNRPVVSTSGARANAFPEGITYWTQLSGWKAPRIKLYHMIYKNGYGMTVVDFSYRLSYSYGGTFNSHGQYLSNVSVTPSSVFVVWGYQFNSSAEIAGIVNTQSSERPVAGMELGVTWKVDNVLVHSENTRSYFIKGNGELTDLTRGN